ncbi:MAG TPA: inositol monophosphatase family protein [Steroidobacteraceae bacterium]|nr:inositol monophosphatase family protein [Steroidobacteraceae bacterium]
MKPRLTPRELRAALPRVFDALRESDAIILRHWHALKVSHKSDGSEVTQADRAAEQALRRRLAKAWPRDAVLGEEYGGELARTGRSWLLDPIDGTASYVLGIPLFGTLVALAIDAEPVLGFIRLPAMRETTYAARGFGCWLKRDGERRPRRVSVAAPRALSAAQIGFTSIVQSDLARRPGPWRLANLARSVGRLRLVGDCVQYALICRGVLDGGIDFSIKPWDLGSLVSCVLEAGGSIGDLHGKTDAVLARTSLVAASSSRLRLAICRQLGGLEARR